MQKGKSKSKGNRYEWKIARILGEWWCKDKDALIPSRASGACVHHHEGIFPGDIVPAKEVKEWCLSVECKNRNDWSFDSLFSIRGKREMNILSKIIKQCIEDAITTKFIPIVIISKNNLVDMIGIYSSIYNDILIGKHGYISIDVVIFTYDIINNKEFVFMPLETITNNWRLAKDFIDFHKKWIIGDNKKVVK